MNNFIIPNEVQVGYQQRTDTYTDRLGFITYIDDLGNMKFENSWNKWKDDTIKTSVFNNEPISGFILNKNGDRSWNRFGGAEFVRVWDPRGHEFEISIDNLMKIILHNGISKGNEINGELVYAWEVGKKKITLMPITCEEYQYQLKTKEQFKDMTLINTVKEIVPGFTYKTKANNIYAYLGHLQCYANDYTGKYYGKRHIFYNTTTGEFTTHKTRTVFTHQLKKIDINPIMEIFSTSIFNTKPEIDLSNADWSLRSKYLIHTAK